GGMVSATATTTNTAQVQTAGSLTISAFTVPSNLTRGQTFTVSMTVTNSGGATANAVLPSPLPPTLTATGGAAAATSTTPSAQDIAGGSSATFSWTYVENGTSTGTLQFTEAASGTDANTGMPLNALSASTNVANVQTPPSLTVTSFTVPSA